MLRRGRGAGAGFGFASFATEAEGVAVIRHQRAALRSHALEPICIADRPLTIKVLPIPPPSLSPFPPFPPLLPCSLPCSLPHFSRSPSCLSTPPPSSLSFFPLRSPCHFAE
eukprot:1541001-Rhodomonas_salina.1